MTSDRVRTFTVPQELTDTPPAPVEGSDDPMPGPSTSERLYGPPAQAIEAESQQTADALTARAAKASAAADAANEKATRERMAVEKATEASAAKLAAASEQRTADAAKKSAKKSPTKRRKAKE